MTAVAGSLGGCQAGCQAGCGAGYLLDTGTCLALLRRSGELRSLKSEWRLREEPASRLYISAITRSELLFAAAMSRQSEQDRQVLDVFLASLPVLDYTAASAQAYAAIREGLHWRQAMLPLHDVLLAAQARALGMAVMTERVKEFGRVLGLVVEGWGG